MEAQKEPNTELLLYKQYLMEEYVAELLKLYRKKKKPLSDKEKALKIRISEHVSTIILYIAAILLNVLQCVLLVFCFMNNDRALWLGTYVPIALVKVIALIFCICSMAAYYKQMYYNVEVYGQALSDISATMPIEEVLKSFGSKEKTADWTIIVDWLRNRPSIVILLIWLLTCIWSPRVVLEFLGQTQVLNTVWEWLFMFLIEITAFGSLFPKRSSFSYWYWNGYKKNGNTRETHVIFWEALLVFGGLFFLFPGILSVLVDPWPCFIIIAIIAFIIYFTLAVFSWNRILSNRKRDKRYLTDLHKLVQNDENSENIRVIFNKMSSLGQIRFLEWLQSGAAYFGDVIADIDDKNWIPKSDKVMVQMMNMIHNKNH